MKILTAWFFNVIHTFLFYHFKIERNYFRNLYTKDRMNKKMIFSIPILRISEGWEVIRNEYAFIPIYSLFKSFTNTFLLYKEVLICIVYILAFDHKLRSPLNLNLLYVSLKWWTGVPSVRSMSSFKNINQK